MTKEQIVFLIAFVVVVAMFAANWGLHLAKRSFEASTNHGQSIHDVRRFAFVPTQRNLKR